VEGQKAPMKSDDNNPPKVPADLFFPKVPADLQLMMQNLALPKVPADLQLMMQSLALPKVSDELRLLAQNLALPKLPEYVIPKMPEYVIPKIADDYVLQMQSLLRPPEAIAGIVELNRLMAEATRPFTDLHRHMSDVIGPLARQLDGFRLPPTLLPQIEDSARQFIEQQQKLAQSLRATVEAFRPNFQALDQGISDFIRNVAAIERKSRLLSEAGFLPHVTMPDGLVDECVDDVAHLSASLEKHYCDNWPEIEDALAVRVASYLIDDEAKETFREALALHRLGHYRAVVRLLFPEIERLARSDGTLSEFARVNGWTKKPYMVLQELAGELPLSAIESGGYGCFVLFQRLCDHLYINADPERMESDAVPNRNAALHGLVVYRSFKNSLNTLIMTDFVFQVVDVVKRSASEKA
jgi:hypothetical protein